MANETPSEPARRRDERRERTRERLLTEAIELLRAEGVSAVTVSRVTKRVGVHHSLFYAHFPDVDACLAAAAARVLETLAPVDRELRRELMKRAVLDRRALARYFENAFERWLAQRPFVELLLAHRLDRSPIGAAMRPALGSMRDDLASELWDIAAGLGLEGRFIREVQTLADLHQAHWLWALEMLVEGRVHDRAAHAASLADIFITTNLRFIERARGGDVQSMVRARFSPEQQHALVERRLQLRAYLDKHDDASVIAHFGGSEGVIERWMEAMCEHFLPGATEHVNAVARYVIEAPDQTISRDVHVHDGVCRLCHVDASIEPRFTVRTSLRTFVETLCGTRHFDEAYRAGDLRVEGELLFAIRFLEWFYAP